MAVSVTIENVVKVFGAYTALKEVSLEVRAGELFFLLGPSGCGKTTLLRCIAGFYRPESGRILIGDEDVTALPPYRRDTGMMFQSYALWPHMTIEENVAFGLEMRTVPRAELRKRVGEALELVIWRTALRRAPISFPAASSSVWPWRVRWSSARAVCCWTSRFRIWTPSYGWRCAWRSAVSASRRASLQSMSRTIRKRRSQWPTASP